MLVHNSFLLFFICSPPVSNQLLLRSFYSNEVDQPPPRWSTCIDRVSRLIRVRQVKNLG